MGEGSPEADFFKILGPDKEDIERSSARTQALQLLAEESFGKPIIIGALQPKGPSGEQPPLPNAFVLASKVTHSGHLVLCENGRIVEVGMSQGFTKNYANAAAYINTFAVSPFVAFPSPLEYPAGPGSPVTSLDGLIHHFAQEGWVERDSNHIGIQAFGQSVRDAISISSQLRHRPPVIQARVYREVYGAFLRDKGKGPPSPPAEGSPGA